MYLLDEAVNELGLYTIAPSEALDEDSLRDRLSKLAVHSDLLDDEKAFKNAFYYLSEHQQPLYLTPNGTWYMPMVNRLASEFYFLYNADYLEEGEIKGTITISARPTAAHEHTKDEILGDRGHAYISVTPYQGKTTSLHATPISRVKKEYPDFVNGRFTPPIKFVTGEHPNTPLAACMVHGATSRMLESIRVDMALAQLLSKPELYPLEAADIGLDLPSLMNYPSISSAPTPIFPVGSNPAIAKEGNCVTTSFALASENLPSPILPFTADANVWLRKITNCFKPSYFPNAGEEKVIQIDLRDNDICPTLRTIPNTEDSMFEAKIKTRRIQILDGPEATAVDASDAYKKLETLIDLLKKEGKKLPDNEAFSVGTILKILDKEHVNYISPRQISFRNPNYALRHSERYTPPPGRTR